MFKRREREREIDYAVKTMYENKNRAKRGQ